MPQFFDGTQDGRHLFLHAGHLPFEASNPPAHFLFSS